MRALLIFAGVLLAAAPIRWFSFQSVALVNARTFSLPGQVTNRRISRLANGFPGADLGAKINAADADLGRAAGDTLVRDDGVISTQVIISPGHSLRFSAGTYRLATQLQDEGGFLLKSRTTVSGSGWDTIIVEPPRTGWIVFQSYETIRSQPTHSGTDTNINISNLQIKGANPAVEGSMRQTISLGNCHDCEVTHVWFNRTSVIGVAAGGNGLAGNFAENVTIKNNLFTQVVGQAAAVVNGRNITIDSNTFKDSGRLGAQGMTPIDIEPNVPNDIIQQIAITNNVIDSRGSTFLHGNGIVVQNGAATRDFGPVLVKGNTIMGGDLVPGISGNIATGIYITAGAYNVSVIENTVQRVAHSGVRLEDSRQIYVASNRLVSTGTGGILAFEVTNTTDSKILDNVVAVDPKSPLGNSVIVESGTSRGNIYKGNTNGRTRITPLTTR